MEIVVEPEGAGIVGSEVVASGTGTESWTGRWTTYKFIATPSRGFEFSRFNVDYHYVAPNVSRYGSKSTSSNPFAGGNSPSWTQNGDAEEYDATYDDGTRYAHEILRVTACFTDIRRTIEVDASASPSNGGTATVDGRASKTYTGVGGESVSFTLNASAAHGYEFVHWKKNGNIYSFQESFVQTETFGNRITEQIHYVAVFREKRYLVSVSVSPPNAGTASGGGMVLLDSSCTVTTDKKCSPWHFDHWETSGGVSVSSNQTYSFSVTADVELVAKYTHPYSGEIMYDEDSGRILSTTAGDIVYNGDLVQA